MHPLCNWHQCKTAKNVAKKCTLLPDYKELSLFIFSSMVVAASCYEYACWQELGSFFGGGDKNKRIRAKHRQNHREKPDCLLSNRQWLIISHLQDNNLKHKAKYTLELFTKTALNVPVWPSYSFDLNWLENLCQDLKMAVLPLQ
jgi:hypothetical protein